MTLKKYKRIGLFDSGVGGLSVLRSLAGSSGNLNGLEFIYLGDTARCPYGNRDSAEIGKFVSEIVGWLTNFQLDAVIMACNTSAAVAKAEAQRQCARVPSLDLFDLIEPTAAFIASRSFKSVGVMATRATVNAAAFSRALARLDYKGVVKEVACPLLVPIIESGELGLPERDQELKAALRTYLEELKGADAIVLGCTHFPFVAGQIRQIISEEFAAYFPDVLLIDPASVLAEQLFGRCASNLEAINYDHPAFKIYTTGQVEDFKRAAVTCSFANIAPSHLDISELGNASAAEAVAVHIGL